MDLHNYKRQFERQIELVKESKEISDENKKIILDFSDYLLSEGIGFAKIGRYLLDLRKLSRMFNKLFTTATETDLRKVISLIEQSELAPESKKGFKVMLRKFYRFIRGITDKGIYPPEVKWISIALTNKSHKLPEELLTEEEVHAIIRNCECIRDKALISTLAESGCRVSEIGTLQIKHVFFETHGARLAVQGKTGARRVIVISSAPYLQTWINEHPKNNNPEAYLWYNPQNTICLCYTRIKAILNDAVRKAGIKKRVYPHLLRHSRATHLAPIMSEAAMKQYFGWTQGSKMASIYIHMSGKETDEAILKANGIIVEKEEKVAPTKPIVCMRCKTANESTNKFCKMCSFVLGEEAQKEIFKKETQKLEVHTFMESLLEDKEVLSLLMKKMQEKNSVEAPA